MSNQVGYPYNRIVQWLAGPVSSGVGLLFSWLAVHEHVVLPASVKNNVIIGVMGAVTFGVSTIATYLAHHKWFTNLAHWFFSQENVPTDPEPPVKADSWTPPTPEEEAEARAALGEAA
jgi:hypothetical protein